MTDPERRLLALLERANVFAEKWVPLTPDELALWGQLKVETLPKATVWLLAQMDGET